MADSAALKNAGRWMKQAGIDLADAEFVAASGRHALACFLSHQSAEKAVTGYLLARGAEMVWGTRWPTCARTRWRSSRRSIS